VKRAVALLLLAALAACESPEAARTRGEGPGADVGNRGDVVRMHEGSQPYSNTPRLIPQQGAPVDSANQAYELSRP
jgi:hypothetical protein